MDAQTFQAKYQIGLGTTYLVKRACQQAPLHYHFSDGYSGDVIKRHTTDRELWHMARLIVYLNDGEPEVIEEVLDDLRQLRQGLYNPYRVIAVSGYQPMA